MSGLGLTFLRRGGQAHPTAGSDYILSENRGDPEVFRILMSKGVSSDGVGITKDDAARVTNIAQWFRGNTAIKNFEEFVFFTNVTQVQNDAFYNCSSLEYIGIPENVTSIGKIAFQNCSSMKGISIIWENITFINTAAFENCASPFDVIYLKNITTLGQSFFKNMPIRKLILGESLTTLPSGGSGYNHWGSREVLEVISFPSKITSIQEGTLGRYTALKSVLVNATTPPVLSGDPFTNTNNNFSIYVPDASVDSYKAANVWSSRASQIKPLSEYTE